MKSLIKFSAVLALATVSVSSFAARPTSVTYVEDGNMADGTPYAHYVVKCSDGQEKDISAFDSRKLWCLGKGEKTDCQKKQIKVAKTVCR